MTRKIVKRSTFFSCPTKRACLSLGPFRTAFAATLQCDEIETISRLAVLHEHRWFSGRMLACHAGGPGSIPGRCNFVARRRKMITPWHRRRNERLEDAKCAAIPAASVAQWLARSAVNRKVGGSTPPGGASPFCGQEGTLFPRALVACCGCASRSSRIVYPYGPVPCLQSMRRRVATSHTHPRRHDADPLGHHVGEHR